MTGPALDVAPVRPDTASAGTPGSHTPANTIAVEKDIFAPFDRISIEKPFIVGQLGQSLDGRIATVSGDSRYIGGTAGLDHLHRLRAHVDAVVVGAATVEADDPQLNVRLVEGRSPARVVIDPRGRLPASGRWLAGDGARRILISADATCAPGCDDLIRLPRKDGRICPAAIAGALFERGFRRILIEGGARTLSAFIDAGMLDRLHMVISPVIIGSGKPSLDLDPVLKLRDALRPPTRTFLLDGGEVLFDCDLAALRNRVIMTP